MLHSRTVNVTSSVVKEYKELITNTTSDLEDHLKEIDAKLQDLSSRGSNVSSEEIAERERVQEERDSTKQCLTICTQVSEHISQYEPVASGGVPSAQHVVVERLRGLILAKRMTSDVLNECKEKLTGTSKNLERHLHEIDARLRTLPLKGATISSEETAERERVQEEKESVQQCLSICAEASQQIREPRTNVFGDVSAGEEGYQVIVATLGDLISARQVTVGDRGTQWLGQMSDQSLQQLSRSRGIERPDSVGTMETVEPVTKLVTKFEGHYGAGYTLE